jgi:cytochrome c oxidase subunit III
MATTTTPAIAGKINGAAELRAASQAVTGAERASRSGIWVAIFAITMSFAAFTSALFVREGTMDWGHLVLPSILYFNTLILLASSGTLEFARKRMDASWANTGAAGKSGLIWLLATLALGAAFCYGQYVAWQDLRAQGIYLATNPNSSFFYLLTFLHVVHVGGGLLALLYVAGKIRLGRKPLRRSTYQNTAIYWHFLGVLWVYLLLLCRMKL